MWLLRSLPVMQLDCGCGSRVHGWMHHLQQLLLIAAPPAAHTGQLHTTTCCLNLYPYCSLPNEDQPYMVAQVYAQAYHH